MQRVLKNRCKQCKAASEKCLNQAILASSTCTENARTMAESRCEFTGGQEGNTVTSWGCSIADMVAGICTVPVGYPWSDKSAWKYGCPGDGGQCSGPGITSCIDSWRLGHPNGSRTVETSGQLSVEFEAVGGTSATTITESYSTNGRAGYAGTCSRVGANLSHGCTSRQIQCYQENECTAQDLQ